MTDFAAPLHQPVMLKQAMELLQVCPGKVWVDATAGAGGHMQEICRRSGPAGTVIGIDRDPASVERLRRRFDGQARIVHGNYSSIRELVEQQGVDTVDGGILADLGVSSMQLDTADRGFSFLQEGPLDMRMDPTSGITAEQLVNNWPEKELAEIIYRYGEERYSRQIAHRIVQSRPLQGTLELAQLVAGCVRRFSKGRAGRDSSHPATRTFQALRLAVNDELGSLEKFLPEALKILAPGARLVVITFHSLEDRLVKRFFTQAAAACICPPRQPVCTCNRRPELLIITRKPVIPDEAEILVNPRCRSAKLRTGEKVA